jgi:hypothetical protein
MSPKQLIVITTVALLAAAAPRPEPATAQPSPLMGQNEPSVSHPGRPRTRIEINPRPLLYRRCVDWYEIQNRPSGRVLFPQMRCWWVRG